MKPSPLHFWTVPCLALWFTLSSTGAAEGKVHLVLSMKPIKAEPERRSEFRRDVWLLRPNVVQEVLTYLQNEDPSQTPTVTVQLLADGAVVASQKIDKVEGKFVPVAWTRPGALPNAPLVMSELKSPVVLRLLDGDGKKQLESVEFGIRRPSEYLKADLDYVPATEERANRLIATVTPTEAFEGPPCRVELVLDTSLPGFVPGKRRSGYSGYVTRPRGTGDAEEGAAYVVVEDVRLREDKSKGLVTIRADDYDRAFLFDTTFARATTLVRARKINAPVVRINTVPMADPRKPVRVSLEADNVETPDTKRLVLDVVTVVDRGGKEGAERFSQLAEFSGARNQRLLGAPSGPNRGLLFKPEVKYCSTDLPLDGLHGKITLRLRLLNDKDEALPVLDTEKEKWEEKVREVRKSIVLDDTPPEGVRVEKIAKAVRGKPFVVRASGVDEESGIREVVFFIGRPLPDGKEPPQAFVVPGKPVKKDKSWEGELIVPADQRGPLEVSARFTNGVGLSTTEVVTLLEVAEPPPLVKVVKKGTIAGIVTEGDRPQVGLKVDLLDAAGKILVSTKTGPKGEYLFKDLDPGDYRVSAIKTASNTKGIQPVPVAPGEDKKGILIKLWR